MDRKIRPPRGILLGGWEPDPFLITKRDNLNSERKAAALAGQFVNADETSQDAKVAIVAARVTNGINVRSD